ncbi:MAG: pitrilysin family protein [Thermoanaerobaculia bacterium]
MRSLKKLVLACAAAVAAFGTVAVAQVKDYHDIKTPPLHQISIQEPKRIELPNGMIVFLQEDHELPLISGTAIVRGGSRDVPADKAGLIGIYGEVWRTGGTATKTGDQLDDFLEARAAKVETDGDIDSTSISFDTLKGDFDPVFSVFMDLLRNPEFRQDKIDLAKNQINTSIARRNDDVGGIAAREATKLAYGSASPYARVPEYDTVAAVTRDDLVAWHKAYVHPNDIILGVVGDFDSKTMEAKLRKAFADWQRGPEVKAPDVIIKSAAPGIYFIPKEDVTQSTIKIVELGTTKNNPDYYAIQVMNEIFGGGFSGRLMNHIRTEKGLAYNVGGGVGTSYDHPGMFQISMGTKSGSTIEAINALHGEIESLQKGPIAHSEVATAKESILNSYIFLLDSAKKVLRERMTLEFYGYPPDFLERYRAGIEKVTPEEVLSAANKYIRNGQLAVLVVGKPEDFDKPLSSLGPVKTIDITIPPPGGAKAEAVTTDDAGMTLLKKVSGFIATDAKLASIKATSTDAKLTVKTPQGEMPIEQQQLVVYPDTIRKMLQTPMGAMTMVSSPAEAFMVTPMGVRDLPGSQKDALQKEIRSDMLYILKNAGQPGFSFSANGTEKIGDVEAQVLKIDAGGNSITWYIDPKSGAILREETMGQGMGGAPAKQAADYTAWQTVDGVKVPKSFTLTVNGEPAGTGEIEIFEINPKIDESLLKKPAGK